MKKFLIICAFFIVLFLPRLSLASSLDNCIQSAGSSATLCNPFIGSAVETNQGFGPAAIHVVSFLGIALAGFTTVYVVFAGFRMIMAQGNSEELETAKAGLQWSILGLLLVLMSYVIIVVMQNYLDVKGVTEVNGTLQNPLTSQTFGDLIFKVMLKGLLELSGTIAVLIIIIAGYRYITASSNEEQAEQAKTTLQWTVLGLIIILLAYVIVAAIANLLPSAGPTIQ